MAHWDGAKWTSPPAESVRGVLYGVDAVTPDDVWAVGYEQVPGDYVPLTMHWDGTSWLKVPSPSPGSYGILYGVSAQSSDDVWAVGSYTGNEGIFPLALHWDGVAWTQSPTVLGSYSDVFRAVSAIGPSDVWAIGQQEVAPFVFEPLVEHWDGDAWTVADLPPLPEGSEGILWATSSSSSTDVWAVGWSSADLRNDALTYHWNGAAWTLVDTPHPRDFGTILYGVSAVSPSDAWAVGGGDRLQDDDGPWSMHWDGLRWTPQRLPNPGNAGLLAVDAISATEIWAAGTSADTFLIPMVDRSDGPC